MISDSSLPRGVLVRRNFPMLAEFRPEDIKSEPAWPVPFRFRLTHRDPCSQRF